MVPYAFVVVWVGVMAVFTSQILARERAREQSSVSDLLGHLAAVYACALVGSAGLFGFAYAGRARAFGWHVNPYALIAYGFLLLGILTARRWWRERAVVDRVAPLLASLGSMLSGVLALANQPIGAGFALVFFLAASAVSLVYQYEKGSRGSAL